MEATKNIDTVIDMTETEKDTYVPEQNTEDGEKQEPKISLKDRVIAKGKKIGKKKLIIGAVVIAGTAYFGPKLIKAVKTAFTAPRLVETAGIAEAAEFLQIPDDLEEATQQILEIGTATVDAAAAAEQVQTAQSVAETAETIGNVVDTATAI